MTQPQTNEQIQVYLITGPAGAGRSTAIRTLEDLEFEAIDNLPLNLVPTVVNASETRRKLAFGLDTRNRDFSTHGVIELLEQLGRNPDVDVQLIYLTCSTDVLLRRYSETRRRHPMAPAETPTAGIDRELDLLKPIKARADILIDTSNLSPHDLRAEIETWCAPNSSNFLAISVQSFSYKRGLPRNADITMDCRFLNNPYWEANLRGKTGRDPEVVAYVNADERFDEFFKKVLDLIEFLLPAYIDEGKSYLSIAFGCTGGQHRSVAVAETLSNALAQGGWQVSTRHRELDG
jgi:UPF0042 nucleotide-binding protein